MDEQRCFAPKISQNFGTPSAQRKEHPSSGAFNKRPQSSPSLKRAKADQHQQVRRHAAELYRAYSLAKISPV